MAAFDDIIGHEAIKSRLITAFNKNRIPSAYLFIGYSGIGKSSLARLYAQYINCETKDFCGHCSNCRLFENGSHPDFISIKPDGQFIKISQIQSLISQLGITPAYASKRVALVKEAHRLNQESANSFLKILEEPPLDTLIILTSSDENLLLETILSRCQKISFTPLSRENLNEILDINSLTPENKEFVLNYSGGAIRKDLVEKVDVLLPMRERVFALLNNLQDESMVSHFNQLDNWIQKDLHPYFFEFAVHLFRDLIFINAGQEELITNKDRLEAIKNQPWPYSEEQLQWAVNLILETETAVKLYAGKVLALESLLIQIKQVFSGRLVI